MAIELMLLAVNINFVAFSHFLQDPPVRYSCFHPYGGGGRIGNRSGDLVVLFRNVRTINVDDLDKLKG